MDLLKVALLQMASCGLDQAAAQEKGIAWCRNAKTLGADIALFPEMWNIGYMGFGEGLPSELARWGSHAIAQDDDFVKTFQALAVELDMAIALTYLEKSPSGLRNVVSVIDRHGAILLTYAKVHTCDFYWERALTPGQEFFVAELDTAVGPVQVGAMICFDREQPESARLLMHKGAELVLIPNACMLEINRITQIRTRAFENMMGMAMANYARPLCNGHSVAYDGVLTTSGGALHNQELVEAGEHEGIYMAAFNLALMRNHREREIWGDSFRHPRLYRDLIDEDVQPPFVRPRSRR